MKRYKEQKAQWCKSTALGFFLNFIKNYKEPINDSDTFELVSSLHTPKQWLAILKKAIPNKLKSLFEKMKVASQRGIFDEDDPVDVFYQLWEMRNARKGLRTVLAEVISEELKKHPPENYRNDIFAKRVSELQTTLKLSDMEIRVLLVLAFVKTELLCIQDGHDRRTQREDKVNFVAKCLDCDVSEVLTALDEKGKICRYQCIDHECGFEFSGRLMSFLKGLSDEPLVNHFFTRCKDETLPWSFYGDMTEKHGNLIQRIVSCCDGTNSANILLYGAPGTGKTSFAKTLAERLHRTCYIINNKSNDKGCQNTNFRFGALQVCAEQVDPKSSLIIVDEADDMLRNISSDFFGLLLGGGGGTVGDKGLLNSILDSIKVPTIWITNTPANVLDESNRRRFDYSIRFDPLTDSQRKMIWHNNISKMKMDSLIDDSLQEKFSSLYPVSAGGITMVLQNVAKLKPEHDEVEELVKKLMLPHCELLGLSMQRDKKLPAKDYSLDGLNIKGQIPLTQIVNAVRNYQSASREEIDRPRLNLLLSGAPGTGKTEFVKFLGTALNTKVIIKMGSDLLSMFVGGTEQRIKAAFAEAEREHAILFLDEIDGLLQSREHAQRSWEVTQVNELLFQMENFNGIMVGATNFSNKLDPAVIRRFTFKLEFDYLDNAGKKTFFERMFQTRLTPDEELQLAAIPRLTPGDFRTVRQSLFYLGGAPTNSSRIEALRQESANKRDLQQSNERRRIGF